jgi:hypothetical protein
VFQGRERGEKFEERPLRGANCEYKSGDRRRPASVHQFYISWRLFAAASDESLGRSGSHCQSKNT